LRRISSRACASFTLAAVLLFGSVAGAELAGVPRFIGTDVHQDDLLRVISTARSRSFKPVGHTSVVLRMRTVARVTAAVKVRSRDLPHGYQHEIAAYRLARLLGLDNVPPAIFRRVGWKEIRRRFHEDKLDERPSVRRAVLWDEDGTAPAAAIYWIKRMRSVGYEDESKWARWLRDAEVPRGKEALAHDLSTMVVFDFLIGNWDRFSGGNLPSDATRQRAILRDNDRAFSTPLLPRRYETLLDALIRTKKFSRTLVERLSELDEAALRRELGKDPSHAAASLLSDAQIEDVFDRRATILSYLAALIEERGEDEVLVFP
jgi:hypothetical protein